MAAFNSGWYVVYTRPNQEKRVSSALLEKRIGYFFPMRKTLRTWSGRKRFVDAPMFSSYVFVYLDGLHAYYGALEVDGVVNYVRTGKELSKVSQVIIDNLKLIVNNDYSAEVSSDFFSPGQQVYIQEGPLTGLVGEIVQCNNIKKILVRVNLLQRNLLISMPSDNLLSVSAC